MTRSGRPFNRPSIIGLAVTVLAAVAVFAVCRADPVSTEDKATVSITFSFPTASASSRSGLTDWPLGGLPVISGATVTASGGGSSETHNVAIEETSATGDTGANAVATATVSVDVGAGNNRRIELTLVPDWDATATAYGITDNSISLVTAYGAFATADLKAGETVALTMTLGVTGTKILVSDYDTTYYTYSLSSVDSLSSTEKMTIMSGYNPFSGTAFDRFGRFYYARRNDGIYQLATIPSGAQSILIYSNSVLGYTNIALDASTGFLWFMDSDGIPQWYDTAAATSASCSIETGFYTSASSALAAADGVLFATGYNSQEDSQVARLVPSTDGATAVISATIDYATIGLSGTDGASSSYTMSVSDMRVQDGVLYILAGTHYLSGYMLDAAGRGALIALNPDDLSLIGRYGFYNEGNYLTTADSTEYFYGPLRFLAVAPKKLIFADEGFAFVDSTTQSGYHESVDINRVIVFNTESGAFKTALDDIASFDTIWPETLYYC